jgi:hypothetical protein
MKIKIVKPSKVSGYLAGIVIDVDDDQLEAIKDYNEIEIVNEDNPKPTEEKIVKSGRGKKASKNQS